MKRNRTFVLFFACLIALCITAYAANESPRRRIAPLVELDKAKLPEGVKAEDIRLFIAIPAYGANVNAVTSHNLIALAMVLQKLGIIFDVQFLFNESLIERARNMLVRMFLDHGARMTHMLFIDSDIEFNPMDVLRLIGRKKDVICGVYPKKGLNWDIILNLARSDPKITSVQLEERALRYFVRPVPDRVTGQIVIDDGVVEAEDCGNGFLLITRTAIDHMKQVYPDLKDTFVEVTGNGILPGENSWFFFEALIEPTTRRFLSEDYTFCKRWTDAGGKLYADLSIRLGHWGPVSLLGNAWEAMVDMENRSFRPGALG